MKIRGGFVSNSSSSNFIVALDEAPKSIDDIYKIFRLQVGGFYRYDRFDGPRFYPNDQVASSLLSELAGPLTIEQIAGEFTHDQDLDLSQFECDRLVIQRSRTRQVTFDWDKYQKACEEYGMKTAEDFIGRYPDKLFFRATYADEDGDFGCAMEHGDVWNAVLHKRISHH
jgi:hypothetical protein